MRLHLEGIIPAPSTPFTEVGDLALPAIDHLCAHLVRQGAAGAFIAGTTGEGLAMTVAERMAVAERWLACAPAGFPVLVHVGALCLSDARALAAHAGRHGAAAVAVLAPCFLKPADAAEVVDWIAAVAAACPATPVTYYHIPALTGVAVRAHAVAGRARERVPNFAGVKFTHEDLDDFGSCLADHGDRLALAFGRDEMLLPALALGTRAAVGSTFNVATPLYRRMIAAWRRGDLAAANAAQADARALIAVLRRHRPLPALKALLAMQGVSCGPCRLPLCTLATAERDALRRDLETLPIAAELFGAWASQPGDRP